jgi:hypothetical protein
MAGPGTSNDDANGAKNNAYANVFTGSTVDDYGAYDNAANDKDDDDVTDDDNADAGACDGAGTVEEECRIL